MAPARHTNPRFGLANMTYAWRRLKEEFSTRVLGRQREDGLIQRPRFEPQQAHMIFLDLGENLMRQHDEGTKRKLRDDNLRSYLTSNYGQEYSKQLLKEVMVRHLNEHGINRVNEHSALADVMNVYHQAENQGINGIRLDEKYHFRLGEHTEASEARVGNYLAEEKDVRDFLQNRMVVSDKISLATALSRYRETLKGFMQDKSFEESVKERNLPRKGNADFVAQAIHAHLPAVYYDENVLRNELESQFRDDPNNAQIIHEQARKLTSLDDIAPIHRFAGNTDAERTANRAHAFHHFIHILPEDPAPLNDRLRPYIHLFDGGNSDHASDFHAIIHTQYKDLAEFLRNARARRPAAPDEERLRTLARQAVQDTINQAQQNQGAGVNP